MYDIKCTYNNIPAHTTLCEQSSLLFFLFKRVLDDVIFLQETRSSNRGQYVPAGYIYTYVYYAPPLIFI